MTRSLYAAGSALWFCAAYLDRGLAFALYVAGLMAVAAAAVSFEPRRRPDPAREAENRMLRRDLEKSLKREAQTNLRLEHEHARTSDHAE